MLKVRVIPTLLLKGRGLVKTVQFKKPTYIGDPLNAVKLFNELEVDELAFLDILATKEKKEINYELLRDIASECFMPFAYGGGIKNLDQIKKLFSIGVEKVIINSELFNNPTLISEAAKLYGSQSILASIDIKKKIFGKKEIFSVGGTVKTGMNPVDFAIKVVELGAGELIVNSIDRDGKMNGYDLELLSDISSRIPIPVIASGGAGKINDFKLAIDNGGASAVSAGSMFVYHGKNKGILINYPEQEELERLFEKEK
jgi:imidazole glycerol-phosphate synthase subunit HisF